MKPRFKWRHQYDDEADKREGDLAATVNDEPSMTNQQFRDDADLNVLAKRFGLNDIPVGPLDINAFRDTTGDPELRDVLETQRTARDAFMQLPAKLRTRFHNSPKELWDFVTDPENAEEAVRLGFLTPTNSDAEPARPGTPSATGNTAPAPTTPAEPTTGPAKKTEGEPKKAPQTP